ncbi:MAG: hypothetical protein MUC50_16825 [Myxococcota bacterium]|nr:hypothetical protein [Myxococcota bacterium]
MKLGPCGLCCLPLYHGPRLEAATDSLRASRRKALTVPYVPGSPIECFCSNCNKDTTHTVLEASGVQVRFARCTQCATEGPYRSPKNRFRAAAMAAAAESARTRGKTTGKSKTPRRRAVKQTPEEQHQAAMLGKDTASAQPYNLHEPLLPGGVVSHPTFGIGIVLDLPEAQKARILFREGEKLLACNRK